VCGIVASVDPRADVAAGVAASRHRGPDAAGVAELSGVTLGHARLAILDLYARSDQPFRYGRTLLSFNGEVWNYRDVRSYLELLGDVFLTQGDTEVVAAALNRWGVDALYRLDGMFAVAWTKGDGILWLARDRFGEIPLHYCPSGAASELKALKAAGMAGEHAYVPPGGVVLLRHGLTPDGWLWHANGQPITSTLAFEDAAVFVRSALVRGVSDRTISDVPVCTLLSGGLDSAVVAWAAKQVMPDLVAYVAAPTGVNGGEVRAAERASKAVGCDLRVVEIPPPSQSDLSRVVTAIEMPHKVQVEIGWPCLILAERIRADGFRVVFSGEGSDELWGSYGNSWHGIRKEGWHEYRRSLFLRQHRKNFPRCNKAFMTAGVECRLPFLHQPLVELAWSLTPAAVRGRDFGSVSPGQRFRKAVLKAAFADVLPSDVVNRPKVAFQTGLGLTSGRASFGEEFNRAYASIDNRRSAKAALGKMRRQVSGVQRTFWG